MCPLSNPGLRELPAELGQLSNLWQLDIEDLNITNVPAEIKKEGRLSKAAPLPTPAAPGREDSSPVIKDLSQKQLQLPWLGRCREMTQKVMASLCCN